MQKGDIVRMKSGSPNLTVYAVKEDTVVIYWWHEKTQKLVSDELDPELLESLIDHVEREKSYLVQSQEGLLRLPAGANDDNTIVMTFADPKMKTEFWERIQAMLPFEVQTIMGGGSTPPN